ncbi:uncharacterized protein K452DRAFT_363329 [Aplosporella prunicola CBS 121167]|uniref:Uncharacterized protein n=1 Tax=Aplosporella prunicola CBS 121167 TaxID=1176127 RepID=A0A6A6ATU7_9PEZI|nr:uncharacterized protein K452DRAFT_363329 [Aplosporella prunicola CBS 121167]KAF2135110.1 hypothetical protein K452DRAFT_363329 [Aplosporella prunicola CBS 121167]
MQQQQQQLMQQQGSLAMLNQHPPINDPTFSTYRPKGYWKNRCIRCEKHLAELDAGHNFKNCTGACWICRVYGLPENAEYTHYGKRCFGPWRNEKNVEILNNHGNMNTDDVPPTYAPRNRQQTPAERVKLLEEQLKAKNQEIKGLKTENRNLRFELERERGSRQLGPAAGALPPAPVGLPQAAYQLPNQLTGQGLYQGIAQQQPLPPYGLYQQQFAAAPVNLPPNPNFQGRPYPGHNYPPY